MASLTSFESFFGNVFNSSQPRSRKHKAPNQNHPHPTQHKQKPIDVPVFESKQKNDKNKNTLGGVKISSYKLKQSKAHRKNSINSKKNELQSNLISLGYNPQNMSLMKQRKLFDKAMKELSRKKQSNETEKPEKKEEDILSFMKDNDLFINAKTTAHTKRKQSTSNTPHTRGTKKRKSSKDAMDIEFGDVLKPEFKKQMDEETFIRTGKSNKSISDRHLLRALKKRDKFIQKRNVVLVDDHATNNAIKKLKGEKVKTDLRFMKNKLKQKYKKKLKSQRQWKQRIARKQYGINKKLDRRDANVAAYRQKKVSRRMKNRITTQQAIAAANM
eukprot:258696_1